MDAEELGSLVFEPQKQRTSWKRCFDVLHAAIVVGAGFCFTSELPFRHRHREKETAVDVLRFGPVFQIVGQSPTCLAVKFIPVECEPVGSVYSRPTQYGLASSCTWSTAAYPKSK